MYGGVLDGRTSLGGTLPNGPALGGGQAPDPRDRGLGASAYTAAGGGGARQAGAPYVGTGGVTMLPTHNVLLLLVLGELAVLAGMRHAFRNYHGG